MGAATVDGHLDVVRVLVRDFGADLNHADNNGVTALMVASHRKHTELVKWLVKEGADPLMVSHAREGRAVVITGLNTSEIQATHVDGKGAAEFPKDAGASAEQTAYLEAKTHCSNTGCSGAGIMKCTGCKQARYCGEECQLAHWQAHKADCKRWRSEAKAGRGK
jgi:hypothetical protein